jgi:hypothetical protein
MRERPVGSVAAPRRNTAWLVTMPKPLLKWRTDIWPLFSMCLLPSNLLDNIHRFFVGLGGLWRVVLTMELPSSIVETSFFHSWEQAFFPWGIWEHGIKEWRDGN